MSAKLLPCCDSRRVTPGCAFFAIPGTHDDGQKYIAEARAKGAAEVIGACPGCDRQVANPREAFAEACADFCNRPSEQLLLCGITGTNGKTTTAWLLRDMLAQGGLLPGLLTTVATQWPGHDAPADRTTPDALTLQQLLAQMVQARCRAAVMEVSSHAIDQARIGSTRFALTAFTNFTQDHLDYHRTMEAYFAVKARLFLEHPAAPAVINGDDPYGARLLELLRTRGHRALCPYFPAAAAQHARFSAEGIEAELTLGGRRLAFRTALCGRYNLANLLCAATAAHALGVSPEAILAAITEARPRWGRLEPAAPRVFVDYAHTDDALTNVLSTLREMTPGRLLCLFGCGGDRDRTKRPKMAAAVDRLADLPIVTSDNPRTEDPLAIIADILPGFTRHKPIVVPDRREAIARALALMLPTDTLLIAGKGHETYQEINGIRHPFSDAAEVRRALAMR
ncbi:MAG: UDP-N-acetylmuramoyl-L-alanyl-D-glutamate--2,6-diaminopimelate ligase [Candidatus Spyradenecus sp.]